MFGKKNKVKLTKEEKKQKRREKRAASWMHFRTWLASGVLFKGIAFFIKLVLEISVGYLLIFAMAEQALPRIIVAYGQTIGLSSSMHMLDVLSIWGFPMFFVTMVFVGLYFLVLYLLWKVMTAIFNKMIVTRLMGLAAYDDDKTDEEKANRTEGMKQVNSSSKNESRPGKRRHHG
jgi:hypothetical protein